MDITVRPPMLLDAFIVQPFTDGNSLADLPNLANIPWPEIQYAARPSGLRYANGTVHPLPPAFEPIMSVGQRKLNSKLLRLFSNTMFRYGFGDQFMLYGGTLLGSFRHHDFIPWDDDLDVIVDEQIRPIVQRLLRAMGPDYVLVEQSTRDKLHAQLINTSKDTTGSRQSSAYSWGWPFLDIGYYRINGTTFCEIAISYGRKYCYPTELVFPLRFRPFGKEWYPAPFDVFEFLQRTYERDDQCVVSGYSHVLEGRGPSGRRACKDLGDKYPFVSHGRTEASIYSANYQNIMHRFVVGREKLILLKEGSEPSLLHTIELPILKSETFSSTYGLSSRSSLFQN